MQASATVALAVAMVTLGLLCAVRALSQTPASPSVPEERIVVSDGLTLRIEPGSGAIHAAVDSVRDNISTAVAGSPKMKAITIAGGEAHGNKIDVHVHRDNPAVSLADRPVSQGKVNIDRGDIEEAGNNYIKDSAANVATVKAGLETEAIAHEIGHTAGTPDPQNIAADNTVIAELGKGFRRDKYCECRSVYPSPTPNLTPTPTDKSFLPWSVDGSPVALHFTDFAKARKDDGKFMQECCGGGGIAEPIVLGSDAAAETSRSSSAGDHAVPIAVAAGLAGVFALAAGGWYLRRRWLR